MSGTSWLLGGGYPWYSGSAGAEHPGLARSEVVANERAGLSLASLADGRFGFASPDDSLGMLALPRGVAVTGGTLLMLSHDGRLVYRYDPVLATLVPLDHVGAQRLCADAGDAAFREPRRFRGATSIAALHDALYVADPAAGRVQVFDLRTLALIRIHAGLDDPVDVAAGRDAVYLLERGRARVHRATPASDVLSLVVDPSGEPPPDWDRLAVDRQGLVYLRRRGERGAELDVFEPGHGHARARIYDSAQVRDRFDVPAITADASGVLEVPSSLLDPCGLREPLDEAAKCWEVADRLYVVDPTTRELRVHLGDGRLRHRFGPLDASGVEVAPDADTAWLPVDLVALDGCTVLLDERHQAVYAHRLGADTLARWFVAAADRERRWRRIAADGGCLLLWDGVSESVDRLDPRGHNLGTVPMRDCRLAFERPVPARRAVGQAVRMRLSRRGAEAISDSGRAVWPKLAYEQSGTWTSRWLDSDLYDCSWHVIELTVARLPPGSSVLVRTRTSNVPQAAEEVAATLDAVGMLGSWQDAPAFVAPAQPDPSAPASFERDVLVRSGPGQHLQLQIVLRGDGVDTPIIARVRLRFPRESLQQYLPAIYSSPPPQREFLDQFLSIVQTTWSGIEREVDSFERYLDPDSVPPEAMAYLAGWLDLQLEGTWNAQQNRRLLRAMPRLRSTWGTVGGLRTWLRVYLSNLGGIDEDDLARLGVPGIVESFVERRRLRLDDGGATLGAADALWSPAVERRFQLGVYERAGEVELVSTGDPHTDVFRHYAHSFRVYVPSALVRTPDDEALLRRAIDLHKPAHASYELVLVEPRLRIGEQSTIELDTVIGDALAGPLACPGMTDPPSRPLRDRLGFDTVLAHIDAGGASGRLERDLA